MTHIEIQRVESCIQTVLNRFLSRPNIFLTEDDVRFHLCSCLVDYFGNEENTEDNDRSISLHTEVRWYGENGDLKTRSDIVLVDVSNLKVLRYLRMPSKGYAFNIPKGIIELKLRRPNGESGPQFLKKIQCDIDKLHILREAFKDAQGHCDTEFWLVILDKKRHLVVGQSEGVHVLYRFSNQRNPNV